MRRRAEEEKKSEAQLATTMKNIEQAAAAQFSRDKDEELRYRKATLGEWVRLCGAGSGWDAYYVGVRESRSLWSSVSCPQAAALAHSIALTPLCIPFPSPGPQHRVWLPL